MSKLDTMTKEELVDVMFRYIVSIEDQRRKILGIIDGLKSHITMKDSGLIKDLEHVDFSLGMLQQHAYMQLGI